MHRVTCCILMLAMLNSCAHWVEVPSPIDQALSPDQEPGRIRVLRHDSTVVELTSPIVTAEFLSGISTGIRQELVVIPREAILRVELSKTDGGGSALVVLGVVGIALVAIVSAFGRGLSDAIKCSASGACR